MTRDWYAPIVADAEAGFGGPLNAYEMMKVHRHLSHASYLRWYSCFALYRQRQLLQVASAPAVLPVVLRFTGYTASGVCSADMLWCFDGDCIHTFLANLQAMIEAGAAGVHFEDQLSSEKKCGHLGGALLAPAAT